MEREPEGRVRYLGQHRHDEEDRLMAACAAAQNPELPAVVPVLLDTGGRRNEVIGLRWEDVDLAQGLVTFTRTKSGKRRSVPMTRAAYEVFAEIKTPRDGRVFRARDIRNAFARACARAGITDFRIHDLRHTFASKLVMRGVGIQTVKELLGHASLVMTLRYSQLSPAHLREAVAALDAPDSARVTQGAREGAELPVTT